MKITLLNIDTKKPFSEYEKYLIYAQDERREKIANCKIERDKTTLLLSHLFARKRIAEELNIPFSRVRILYNQYGKPYVEHEGFHFSVSHSGNLIAFAHHSSPIGIDVEMIKDSISPAIRFFTENEKAYINNNPESFFEIWTKKEAYVKYTGKGLSEGFKTFDVLEENIKKLFLTTCCKNFHITLCGEGLTAVTIHRETAK